MIKVEFEFGNKLTSKYVICGSCEQKYMRVLLNDNTVLEANESCWNSSKLSEVTVAGIKKNKVTRIKQIFRSMYQLKDKRKHFHILPTILF